MTAKTFFVTNQNLLQALADLEKQINDFLKKDSKKSAGIETKIISCSHTLKSEDGNCFASALIVY